MMLHPAWIEREEPLARCPRKDCRRSHRCHRPASKFPCQRSHETKENFRWKLARKMERLAAEARSRNPEPHNMPAEGSYEFELKLKKVKEMFWESDRADCERQKAEAAAQKRRPAKGRASHSGYQG